MADNIELPDLNDGGFMENIDKVSQIENIKWQYRRKIAFYSLEFVTKFLIGLVALAVCDSVFNLTIIDEIAKFSEIIIVVLVGLIGLTGAYMGLASVYGSNMSMNLGRMTASGENEAIEKSSSSLANRIKTE